MEEFIIIGVGVIMFMALLIWIERKSHREVCAKCGRYPCNCRYLKIMKEGEDE